MLKFNCILVNNPYCTTIIKAESKHEARIAYEEYLKENRGYLISTDKIEITNK
jgi:hypothetical protein